MNESLISTTSPRGAGGSFKSISNLRSSHENIHTRDVSNAAKSAFK